MKLETLTSGMSYARASALLAVTLYLHAQNVLAPSPSPEQQSAMLTAMKTYAQQYVRTLPDFLCVQETEQFRSGTNLKHWKKGETLTARLAYVDGHEKRTLQLVNGKPPQFHVSGWHMPLSTEGEFGDMLERAFADDSHASFKWVRWDTVQGKRVAVFDYSIEQQHSTLKLTASDLASAILPYHGSVYADPVTGVIWRISDDANKMPPDLRTYEIGTTVDYDSISIGDNSYVLPVHASVLCRTFTASMRNEIYFRDYRKFEAESTLKFNTPGDPP
jgi:hypothetical protein